MKVLEHNIKQHKQQAEKTAASGNLRGARMTEKVDKCKCINEQVDKLKISYLTIIVH